MLCITKAHIVFKMIQRKPLSLHEKYIISFNRKFGPTEDGSPRLHYNKKTKKYEECDDSHLRFKYYMGYLSKLIRLGKPLLFY